MECKGLYRDRFTFTYSRTCRLANFKCAIAYEVQFLVTYLSRKTRKFKTIERDFVITMNF